MIIAVHRTILIELGGGNLTTGFNGNIVIDVIKLPAGV
jgi:hypothetical protein